MLPRALGTSIISSLPVRQIPVQVAPGTLGSGPGVPAPWEGGVGEGLALWWMTGGTAGGAEECAIAGTLERMKAVCSQSTETIR